MCSVIYLLNMGKFNVALREVVAGGTLGRKCMALVWLPRFFFAGGAIHKQRHEV